MSITFSGLSFKNPDFGNTFTIALGILTTRNQGDDLYAMALPERKLNNQIGLKLSNLSLTEVNQLQDAIIASQATLITMIDHEEREWTGFFSGDMTVTRGRRLCENTIEFNFEGDISGQVQGIDN
jgi:hypothetical protein